MKGKYLIRDKKNYQVFNDNYMSIISNKQYSLLIDKLMDLNASFIVANKNDILIKKMLA